MTMWFVSLDDGQTSEGPYSGAEVLARLRSGRLSESHLARTGPGSPWALLRSVLPKLQPSPPSLPPQANTWGRAPEPRPKRQRQADELVPRDAKKFRNTGHYEEEQFTQCWNALDRLGYNGNQLRYFACTLRDPGKWSTGGSTPQVHLAIFTKRLVTIAVSPSGQFSHTEYPLDEITWKFLPAEQAQSFAASAASFWQSLSGNQSQEYRTARALAISNNHRQETVFLQAGSGCQEIERYLPTLYFGIAEYLGEQRRLARAELFLSKIPPGSWNEAEVKRLQAKLAPLVKAEVDHRQGLPGVAPNSRGLLRLDRNELEFTDLATKQSLSIPLSAIGRVFPLKQGLYPAEFAQHFEAQRKKVVSSQFASIDPLMYVGAQMMTGSAKQDLAEARFGQPMLNRIVIAIAVAGKVVPVIFDVAGMNRGTIERTTNEFLIQLETIVPKRPAPSIPSTPSAPPLGPGTTGSTWEPPGIRDRLTTAKTNGHLTGEDYGFLMTILGRGPGTTPPNTQGTPNQTSTPAPSSPGTAKPEEKKSWLPDLSKIDLSKLPKLGGSKPGTPPAPPPPPPNKQPGSTPNPTPTPTPMPTPGPTHGPNQPPNQPPGHRPQPPVLPQKSEPAPYPQGPGDGTVWTSTSDSTEYQPEPTANEEQYELETEETTPGAGDFSDDPGTGGSYDDEPGAQGFEEGIPDSEWQIEPSETEMADAFASEFDASLGDEFSAGVSFEGADQTDWNAQVDGQYEANFDPNMSFGDPTGMDYTDPGAQGYNDY